MSSYRSTHRQDSLRIRANHPTLPTFSTPPPSLSLSVSVSVSVPVNPRSTFDNSLLTTRSPPHTSSVSLSSPAKRLLLALIVFISFTALTLHFASDTLALFGYKLRDQAYDRAWVRGCGIRKRPLTFINGEAKMVIVWETNCDQRFELRWDVVALEEVASMHMSGVQKPLVRDADVTQVKIDDETDTHWVYQSTLEGLVGGSNYVYEIISPSEDRMGSSTGNGGSKVIERQIVPFVGPTPSIPTPTIIHIAALADNQFNVRIFHRVLLALHAYSKSLPLVSSFSSSTTITIPSLIIHAGDKVQDADNLAQWQTDFWEPMSRLILDKFKRSIPILSTRGNHDWDKTGINAYTGGRLSRDKWKEAQSGPGESQRVSIDYEGGTNARGMFMSYSPHSRCRIIVLDSNLNATEEVEQESWLKWELEKNEWKEASLRIVLVHVPPFLEYWDQADWIGGQNQW